MTRVRFIGALVTRALVRPAVGAALVRVAWRFRSHGWYRRPPFLPIPDRDYVRWRMDTAYGDPDAVPPIDAIVRYAEWVSRSRLV